MKEMENSNALQMLRAMDRIRRAWKNASPSETLNKSQFFTLMTLHNKGADAFGGKCPHVDPYEPMTLSALAKAMNQSMPAVSQRIRRLEELGYVCRTPDESDRRTMWIALTGQGNALLQENCRDMFRRLERMMTRLERQGERTPAQVIEAFNYLADAMEEEFGTP
ncbi:MarR family winged helix-turn-helix transcriptional regulator [Allofournierella massiliensis]|uniref:DNA-binding MarR family transcriptional regulator n=2 Tax=Allofournierella massiliensis TaxID=1650663 RepID=A0A4R1QGU5_9FIRM|nr:MarR family transcriptional regulator [Fournierella massiliensis]TCL50196.1 DNA-binding MarR family transcriptional regulator [Fournierella massiliensis]